MQIWSVNDLLVDEEKSQMLINDCPQTGPEHWRTIKVQGIIINVKETSTNHNMSSASPHQISQPGGNS